jgi:hypothetical protein
MRRRFKLFCAVVAALLVAIALRCALRILVSKADFDEAYKADPAEKRLRWRSIEGMEIADTEKQVALVALFALPIGATLAMYKSNAGRRR